MMYDSWASARIKTLNRVLRNHSEFWMNRRVNARVSITCVRIYFVSRTTHRLHKYTLMGEQDIFLVVPLVHD